MFQAFKKHLKVNKFSTNYHTGSLFHKTLLNGSNASITIKEGYQKYQQMHLPTLSPSSKEKKKYRMDKFLSPILDFKMAILTPQFVAQIIEFWKSLYKDKDNCQRSNFDKELADLRSFLNWYRDTMDFQFQQPVKPFHKKLAVLKEIPYKERVISSEQVKLFLSKLNSQYRDFATLQLFCAGRVGEIAGFQLKNIDLEKRTLVIREVIVWIKGLPQVKSLPKNGRPRSVYINDTMLEIIKRRIESKTDDSPFLFSKNGQALRYNLIGAAYNRAWKKSGLTQYQGTHQIRYAGAQISRNATGSLEAVKAITGHVSDAMAMKYSEIDTGKLNRETVLKCEEFFNQVA